MNVSIIICTRNRAGRLAATLARLPMAAFQRHNAEFVLVDSASDDSTPDVLRSFSAEAPVRVTVVRAERKGLGLARNTGIAASQGELLVFTDDDCYIAEDYLDVLIKNLDENPIQYGGGDIVLYDESDARLGFVSHKQLRIVQPNTVLRAGHIQGANMFFRREVFDTAGCFNPAMGAGALFPCEDIEMATRASLAGFTGALVPGLTIHHHSGIRKGTERYDATIQGYDFGRGAYYASLIAAGRADVWDVWPTQWMPAPPVKPSKDELRRLKAEFDGAARYLAHILDAEVD